MLSTNKMITSRTNAPSEGRAPRTARQAQQKSYKRATTASETRPALAICDWGLQPAVKTAVACHRAGVDHLLGLRLRLVPLAAVLFPITLATAFLLAEGWLSPGS